MAKNAQCCFTWGWIIQILLWLAIIFIVVAHLTVENGVKIFSIILFSFSYLAYLITACCSPMCSYLFNKHKADSIHNYMKTLYYNPPIIEWHVECYHYVTRHHTTRDSKGNTKHHTSEEKVVTHRETERLNYYTWRDISGLFLLDSHKVFQGEKKVYIKLELALNVEFADEITRLDYQRQKDSFYHRNRWRDSHISFRETTKVDGHKQYHMVRISDKRPPCVNGYMYLLLTFVFPIVELFKLYVNQFCIDQDYTLKKVLSTRYNLIEEEHAKTWVASVPQIVIFSQPAVIYNDAPQPMHNSPVLPSMDELETAKTFNHQVSFQHQPADNYTPHFTGQIPPQQEVSGQMYSSMAGNQQPSYYNNEANPNTSLPANQYPNNPELPGQTDLQEKLI